MKIKLRNQVFSAEDGKDLYINGAGILVGGDLVSKIDTSEENRIELYGSIHDLEVVTKALMTIAIRGEILGDVFLKGNVRITN